MSLIREILSGEERLKRKAARARKRRANKRLGIKPAIKEKLSVEQRAANRTASARAYYRRNVERMRDNSRKWHAANPEKASIYNKAWREAHPDAVKAIKDRSRARAENKVKENARSATRRAAKPEEYRARSAAWASANPGKMRIAKQNRRAQKKERGGRLSRGLPARLMKLQRGKCACCHADLANTNYDLDHVEPLALGGAHEDKNMQLLCPTCNRSKSAKHPIDFMQSRGFLL